MWELRKQIYTDVWNLHKKYFHQKDIDYDSLTKDMQDLSAKYDCEFCSALLIAMYEDLDDRWADK